MTRREEQAYLGAAELSKDIRCDRRRPTNKSRLGQKVGQTGNAEMPGGVEQAFPKRNREVVRSSVSLKAVDILAVIDQGIGHCAPGINID